MEVVVVVEKERGERWCKFWGTGRFCRKNRRRTLSNFYASFSI